MIKFCRQGVVLLPGAAQLQEKDISWRIKASQADCILAGPEIAPKVCRFSAPEFS
jgi:ABC-type Zn2+ transport system substrate-binding protein/surface adhesin